MSKAVQFVVCLLLPLVVGGLSGAATAKGVSGWYQTLLKPPFNPPNYLFGPVWTVLYLAMGVTLYYLWQQPAGEWRTRALALFGLQLTLNFFWSIIFFYWQQPGWALVEITLMWLSIAAMIFALCQVKTSLALSQVPYLLWVSFASVLNASIWWLNR